MQKFILPLVSDKNSNKGDILVKMYNVEKDYSSDWGTKAQNFWAAYILFKHHGFTDIVSDNEIIYVSFTGEYEDCSFHSLLWIELERQDRCDEFDHNWDELLCDGLIDWDFWENWTGVELRQL